MMNAQSQLKALQQILETLNIAASRQTDVDFKKDGNKHFTTAIQNTKKLMNVVEEEIIYENDLSNMLAGCASLSLNNMD